MRGRVASPVLLIWGIHHCLHPAWKLDLCVGYVPVLKLRHNVIESSAPRTTSKGIRYFTHVNSNLQQQWLGVTWQRLLWIERLIILASLHPKRPSSYVKVGANKLNYVQLQHNRNVLRTLYRSVQSSTTVWSVVFLLWPALLTCTRWYWAADNYTSFYFTEPKFQNLDTTAYPEPD